MTAPKEGMLKIADAAFSAIVVSANRTSDPLELRSVSSGSVFTSWTGASAADAVVKLQSAPTTDGPWEDIASATKTIGAASGDGRITLTDVPFPYIRAVATKNSETTAALTLRYYFKGVAL